MVCPYLLLELIGGIANSYLGFGTSGTNVLIEDNVILNGEILTFSPWHLNNSSYLMQAMIVLQFEVVL